MVCARNLHSHPPKLEHLAAGTDNATDSRARRSTSRRAAFNKGRPRASKRYRARDLRRPSVPHAHGSMPARSRRYRLGDPDRLWGSRLQRHSRFHVDSNPLGEDRLFPSRLIDGHCRPRFGIQAQPRFLAGNGFRMGFACAFLLANEEQDRAIASSSIRCPFLDEWVSAMDNRRTGLITILQVDSHTKAPD